MGVMEFLVVRWWRVKCDHSTLNVKYFKILCGQKTISMVTNVSRRQ